MSSRQQHFLLALLLVILVLLAALPVAADFPVARDTEVESRPAVAFNAQTGEFFVAYLERQSDILGNPIELRVRRFNALGTQIGSVLQPLGSASHEALGRPAIAYGSADNVILVAVPESRGGMPDRVIARFLAADGSNMVGPDFLFDDGVGFYHDGLSADGNGSLQITYNSLLNEFVVTVQRTTVAGDTGVWAQKITTTGGAGGAIVHMVNVGIHGQNSHDIEHAAVPTSPPGGRYLFVNDGFVRVLEVRDANLNFVTAVTSLDWGTPIDGLNHRNIAFGRVEGKDRWMIVWADENNCWPGHMTCTDPAFQWTGVWGGYIDPLDPNGGNTAFPISKINSHVVTNNLLTPRVGYNRDAESFYVAWREVPVEDPLNDQSLSHIRGNRIDYFVEPGTPGALVPIPYDNTVLSQVSGTCPPTGPCFSQEDPVFPDVSANDGFGAVSVWQEKYVIDPSDHDIWGNFLNPPVPDNDTKSSPLFLAPSGPPLEVTLVGAFHDGESDCGGTEDEPDVWFLFEATAPGTLIAATCGSNDLYGADTGMDTVLSFHRPDGTQHAGGCNDDYPASNVPLACDAVDSQTRRDSALAMHVNFADQVLVRVSRFEGTYGGRFILNYGFEPDPDSDGDGIADPLDNCIHKPNPAQRDSNGDNIGNFCDPDLNDDCIVNVVDLGLLKSVFFTNDPHADFNGDNAVNSIDLGLMKSLFFQAPGPSGLPNACAP